MVYKFCFKYNFIKYYQKYIEMLTKDRDKFYCEYKINNTIFCIYFIYI